MRELLCYKNAGKEHGTLQKYIALVGADMPADALADLEKINTVCETVVLKPDTDITSPICTHPDTILCIFKGRLYCHKNYAEKNPQIEYICSVCGLEAVPCDTKRSGTYPYDVSFNALCDSGNRFLIARKASVCAPLKEMCLDTKQGYAACCAVFVGDTVVSADPSIIKTARAAGLPYRSVNGKGIKLRGYGKGFIGGCTGTVTSADGTPTVLTVGDPASCPAGRELYDICKGSGVRLVPLGSGPLTDVGGIKTVPVI